MTPRIVPLSDCPHAIEKLAAWHHEQWGHLNPQRTLADRIAKFQSHLHSSELPATFVALDGEALLGSASIVECDLHQRSDLSPWLASVYVAPKFRGHGIGNRLVERVEKHAAELKIAKLYLFTLDREAFYACRGWQRFGEESFAETTIVLMSLKLET